MTSVVDPNCAALTCPSPLLAYHHSATDGRKIETSVFPSPSKSNGARPAGVYNIANLDAYMMVVRFQKNILP